MTGRALQTKRLKLRPLHRRDVDDIARLIADWDVIRWLTTPPWPYSRADAAWFVGDPASDDSLAIEFEGCFAGIVSGSDELGYWLGKPFWGQGLMTEAAEAVLADHFAHSDEPVTSGYLPGNAASSRVLTKLGFRESHVKPAFSRPLGREVVLQGVTLTLDHWRADRPLRIETERLVIRPFARGDLDRFLAIAGQAKIADMMTSIPHPLSRDAARDWIGIRQFRGDIPFCAAIAERDGPMIGVVGIGGNPVSTMYFIDPAHWGKGYATEAMRSFLEHVVERFGLEAVTAGANAANPASLRVLEKLNFVESHRQNLQSSHRLEPDPVIMYRLSRTR